MCAAQYRVNLVFEMVEHYGGALIRLEGFPWIYHEPMGSLFGSKCAHIYSEKRWSAKPGNNTMRSKPEIGEWPRSRCHVLGCYVRKRCRQRTPRTSAITSMYERWMGRTELLMSEDVPGRWSEDVRHTPTTCHKILLMTQPATPDRQTRSQGRGAVTIQKNTGESETRKMTHR